MRSHACVRAVRVNPDREYTLRGATDSYDIKGPEGIPVRDWWVVLVWGVVAILLGLLLIVRPGLTTLALVRVMAAFWLMGGFFDVLGSLLYREEGSGARMLLGIVSMLAGGLLLANSLIGTAILVSIQYYMLGFIALIYGIVMMLKQGARARWSWGQFVLGMLQAFIGIMLLAHPTVGILGFLSALGVLIMMGGVLAILLSFQVRRAAM
ncbi:MAG: HdeD family acid-resistance protein [Longimicrobiales bacterium]